MFPHRSCARDIGLSVWMGMEALYCAWVCWHSREFTIQNPSLLISHAQSPTMKKIIPMDQDIVQKKSWFSISDVRFLSLFTVFNQWLWLSKSSVSKQQKEVLNLEWHCRAAALLFREIKMNSWFDLNRVQYLNSSVVCTSEWGRKKKKLGFL